MEKEYFVLYTPDEMNKAYNLFERDYSKSEIFDVLSGDDDIEKQVCLIKLEAVESGEDAQKLISVLTGQHGPVREICSSKINDFLKKAESREFFKGENVREICLNSLNDIIPTVARNILEVIKFLPEKETVCDCLLDRIVDLQNYTDDETLISNHEIIKKTFKLYWYLEALAEFADILQENEKFLEIIKIVYNHEDYTIREKVSKLLSKLQGFEEYKDYLKNDENPYVFSFLR